MFSFFQNSPTLVLVLSGIGALVSFFLINHFRTYVLDGSIDPIKVTSLRYLQIFVGLLTLCLLGVGLSLVNLAKSSPEVDNQQQPLEQSPLEATTEEPVLQQAPEATMPNSGTSPTSTLAPTPQPTATSAPTAVIGNTGGAGANMRSVPGLQGTIITSVNDGTEVSILGGTQLSDNFTWQLILLPDGRQGWVVTNFLIYNQY